jgi:cytochrome c
MQAWRRADARCLDVSDPITTMLMEQEMSFRNLDIQAASARAADPGIPVRRVGAARIARRALAAGAALAWAALAYGAPAAAQTTGLDLAKSVNCLACHQVRDRRVGPPFAAVAQRFAGQQGAPDYLAQSIRSGGKGRWGAVPMPAQPQVSAQQARELAEWILSLAKRPEAN